MWSFVRSEAEVVAVGPTWLTVVAEPVPKKSVMLVCCCVLLCTQVWDWAVLTACVVGVLGAV